MSLLFLIRLPLIREIAIIGIEGRIFKAGIGDTGLTVICWDVDSFVSSPLLVVENNFFKTTRVAACDMENPANSRREMDFQTVYYQWGSAFYRSDLW